MTKALTYAELMDLALEYYNKGGDVVYECWDEKYVNEYVAMFGAITRAKALKIFKGFHEEEKEEMAILDAIKRGEW